IPDEVMKFYFLALHPVPCPGMRGKDDRKPVGLGNAVESIRQMGKIVAYVDIFLAMCTDYQVFPGFEVQLLQNAASGDILFVPLYHFEKRCARDENMILPDTFAQQIASRVLRIGQVDIADVIGDPPVSLLRYILIET